MAARPWTPTSIWLAEDGTPPPFGKRERCPVALTAPIDIQTPSLITDDVHGSEVVVHGDDLKGVRLYCRLAAAMSALTLVLLAFFVIWISTRLFGWHWDSPQTLVALTVVLVAAAVNYLRAELRLRSYRLDLTCDAVIFEYGRKRSYVPREHIQLFDTETSILLRIFRLRRCNLHTGGGMVVVSPVPARVASAITRLIYEQPALMRADRTDANT
jgi:membrane protein YdbS with pleckstrin-like domain